uniref:Uncharacterized protein n=1 Tax=Bradyrhizobium amphicarpaeae TaxID=1404768 RepID=A0A2U8PWR4_9BRAD|nr:hypothetical protein CIT40_20955 [Bradyrhizobium amphicarpaeae]
MTGFGCFARRLAAGSTPADIPWRAVRHAVGWLMVVAQAIATGVFAELQYVGLRKSARVAAALGR